jgi:hypothetical protein
VPAVVDVLNVVLSDDDGVVEAGDGVTIVRD